jgi:hypothetical protein
MTWRWMDHDSAFSSSRPHTVFARQAGAAGSSSREPRDWGYCEHGSTTAHRGRRPQATQVRWRQDRGDGQRQRAPCAPASSSPTRRSARRRGRQGTQGQEVGGTTVYPASVPTLSGQLEARACETVMIQCRRRLAKGEPERDSRLQYIHLYDADAFLSTVSAQEPASCPAGSGLLLSLLRMAPSWRPRAASRPRAWRRRHADA